MAFVTTTQGGTIQIPDALANGALPTAYDPAWRSYSAGLTQAQSLAFEAFPQDLLFYAETRRWLAENDGAFQVSVTVTPLGSLNPVTIPVFSDDRSKTLLIGLRQGIDDNIETTQQFKDANGNWTLLDATGIRTVHSAVFNYVASLFAAENQIHQGVAGKTITTRKQIDAIFAAIAVNSPSAINPSAT